MIPVAAPLAWVALASTPAGSGGFSAAIPVPTVGVTCADAQPADLDGDGDLDLAVAYWGESEVGWFQNLGGGGSFGEYSEVVDFSQQFCWRVEPADLDGDGDLDLAWVSVADSRLAWYENVDGLGSFGPQKLVYGSNGTGPRDLEAEDMDGDGDLDLLDTRSLVDDVNLYVNDGTGAFSGPTTLTGNLDGAYSLVAADLGGDAFPDVLVSAVLDADQVVWLESFGGGSSFSPTQLISQTSGFTETVAAGDLDGDLDVDVVAGSSATTKLVWHANDGAGGFGPEQALDAGAAYQRVGVVDLDSDGDADVVGAQDFEGRLVRFENLGGGAFGPLLIVDSALNTPDSLEAGDLDGDGDLDLVGSGNGFISWYQNLSCPTSLPSSEIVRLGAPPNPAALLPGQTSGPVLGAAWDPLVDHSTFLPGATVDVLGITATPANVPLPPYGTLLCDLSTPPVLFTGPAGNPFSIAVPTSCSLAGASLCAQAASTDGATLGLTNALDLMVGTF